MDKNFHIEQVKRLTNVAASSNAKVVYRSMDDTLELAKLLGIEDNEFISLVEEVWGIADMSVAFDQNTLDSMRHAQIQALLKKISLIFKELTEQEL